MITLTIMFVLLLILAVAALLSVLTLGGGILIVFGDVLLGVAIVWFIIKLFRHKNKKESK